MLHRQPALGPSEPDAGRGATSFWTLGAARSSTLWRAAHATHEGRGVVGQRVVWPDQVAVEMLSGGGAEPPRGEFERLRHGAGRAYSARARAIAATVSPID